MKKPMPAHLVSKDDHKCCSVCGKQFPPNSQPSISKAFVERVRSDHKLVESPKPAEKKPPRKTA